MTSENNYYCALMYWFDYKWSMKKEYFCDCNWMNFLFVSLFCRVHHNMATISVSSECKSINSLLIGLFFLCCTVFEFRLGICYVFIKMHIFFISALHNVNDCRTMLVNMTRNGKSFIRLTVDWLAGRTNVTQTTKTHNSARCFAETTHKNALQFVRDGKKSTCLPSTHRIVDGVKCLWWKITITLCSFDSLNVNTHFVFNSLSVDRQSKVKALTLKQN